MSQRAASKIHLVTKSYLAQWALPPAGLLRPVSVKYGDTKPKKPAAAGWARDWWSEGDPALNQACEDACARLENDMPRVFENIERRWPVDVDNERALLGQFIALHVVRTDASLEWFAAAREQSLASLEERWDSPMPFAEFATEMRSDAERARKLLTLIGKLASNFASMHWTLLRFPEPWIITSDHPACPVPLLEDGERAEVMANPGGGWMNTIELRFPLSPWLVLLGTWFPSGDEGDPLDADWFTAVNVNGVLRAQARRQWFRVHPGPMPPLPPAIFREYETDFEPLAPDFLSGYDMAAARRSPRRRLISEEIEKMVESQDDQSMFVARPNGQPVA